MHKCSRSAISGSNSNHVCYVVPRVVQHTVIEAVPFFTNTAYAPAVNGRPTTASRGSRLKAAERLTSKFTKQSQNHGRQPAFLAPSE